MSRYGSGTMRGTGRIFGHPDGDSVVVSGKGETVTSERGEIGASSWIYDLLQAHTNGLGVGSQIGVAVEPVITQSFGVTNLRDIGASEFTAITTSNIQYGRGGKWGEGFQWGTTDFIAIPAAASGPTGNLFKGVASWPVIDSERRDDVLGRSRQIGLATPTHLVSSVGPYSIRGEISAAVWGNPETGRRTDTWGFGRQYGQGYEFGQNENDERLSIATSIAIGLTRNRGEIGEFVADLTRSKSVDDLLGLATQLGLSVDTHIIPAFAPKTAIRTIGDSQLVRDINKTLDKLYGRGKVWGEGTQFGTRDPEFATASVLSGPSTIRYIGTGTWFRNEDQISVNGLGHGVAIGIAGQLGEFGFVEYILPAAGPTALRGKIGSARRIFRFWAINAEFPIPATEEIRTHDQLSLTLRAKKPQVISTLRPLFDASSGEVDVITKSGGSYEAFDTSQSGNQFAITPAHRQRPTRVPRDYLVDSYDEQIVDQEGEEYEISIDFVPEKTREPDEDYEGRDEFDHEFVFEEREENQWQFSMSHGTIATQSITKEIERGGDEINLTMVLKPKQTQTFEESASYVEGITEREIPDGDNKWDDDSPGNRNTAYIVPPEKSEGVFDEGNYRITDWTTRRINYESYEVRASFTQADDPGQTTEALATTGEGTLDE